MAIKSKLVLIVEDDLTNRLVLRALINESGYESIEAENGELAVTAVEQHNIDIILMDVMMPVMDGYAAAKIIKSKCSHFIPIIFLTAITDESALAACIEAGGDDFLTKPYNHILLNSKIQSMLRISELYKNIEKKNRLIEASNIQINQEMRFASKLFNKISSNDLRGEETGLRYSMSSMSMFNGDLILSERNQTSGLDLLIADFTGHGLSAAIGAIPVSDVFHSMTQKCFPFIDMLLEANIKLMELLPTEMFMAGALLSVDRSNNVLSVMNAGLPDIYLYRNDEIYRIFKSKNLPLGIRAVAANQFEIDMEPLQYGDRIFVMTDGIMEATSASAEMFGIKRVLDVFTSSTVNESIFDSILSSCNSFCEGAVQADDMTLLELCHIEASCPRLLADTLEKFSIPSNWSFSFDLDIETLRKLDVLPYIMQGVNQLLPLQSGRTSIQIILTEMFANALDHGLLNLSSSMKNNPKGYMNFYNEKQKRLESIQNGGIQIKLKHELNTEGGGRLTLDITDSGEGFDYQSTDITSKNQFSGRGLKLVSSLCTELKVLGKGNSFTVYYDWQAPSEN